MSSNSKVWYGVNLASARLGAEALYASDDFFAPKERMLQDHPAEFIDGKYDDNGKWMDGWESRRKRSEGNDYCIVKLGVSGRIDHLDIDTTHFTGNYPPAALIQACNTISKPDEHTVWSDITETIALQGNQHHIIAIEDNTTYSHVKVTIYPDGGIARLRVYGKPDVDWQAMNKGHESVDLLALENGGRAVECNDEHFGTMHNLNAPGRGINMGDGWETRRRREPGNDWAIMQLGHEGIVDSILIDTAFFKGNFPAGCSIQATNINNLPDSSLAAQSIYWQELLPRQPMQADNEHSFKTELNDLGAITHIRLNLFPDGGVSRLRLFGKPVFK